MEIPSYAVLCYFVPLLKALTWQQLITSDFKATYLTSKLKILLLLPLAHKP